MRILLSILLLSNFYITGLTAQSNGAEDMLTAEEFVEEEIEGVEWKTEKFHRLGEIPQNKPVSVTFEFVNTGEEPLLITMVQPSCRCSVSEFTKEPIPKGGTGVIHATYDAKEEGAFFKTFMLLTNRSKTPNVLFIEGTTAPPGK